MRKALFAVLLLFCATAHGMTYAEYKENKDKDWVKYYMHGILSGLYFANVASGKGPFYCNFDDINLDEFMNYVTENYPHIQPEAPLGFVIVIGLKNRYPCKESPDNKKSN